MRELDEGAFPQAGDDRVVIGSAGLPTTSISMGDGNDFFQGGPEDDGGGGTMGDDVLKMGAGNDGRGYVLGVSEGADLIEGEGGPTAMPAMTSSTPTPTLSTVTATATRWTSSPAAPAMIGSAQAPATSWPRTAKTSSRR